MSDASPGLPTRRRDAEENRARIVAAAREVFATAGFDAPLDAIARRAGVGRATLYRNFPDRFVLGAAIFEENLAKLEALAEQHRGQPDGFMTLLASIVEQQIEGHALVPGLLTGPSMPDLQVMARRVTGLLAEPLRRAREAGKIRHDLVPADVLAALAMISAVVAGDASVGSRRKRAMRALDLLVHGLAPRETTRPAR